MKIFVANPIYDSVFKFLMEDERIAKTVLSALLKKEVVSVEMRRHEHPNITRDNLSMFRIDFAAKVKEADDTTRLMLIELQKTWLDTETLRFRRYLAAQYNAEENMQKDGKDEGFALPMVAVYILGHRVGDIDKPVVYVGHKTIDYDGQEVESGKTDPFINSLVHDSIIVQIPLLHGKINNRLDKVLSVFDQKQRDKENQQVIGIDENLYMDDPEMMHIIHRLTLATVSATVRQEMNDEDEYFSAIEERDTQLMKLNKTLSEKDEQLSKMDAQISEKDEQLSKMDAQISEKDEQLSKKDAQISEKDEQLSKKDEQLSKKDEQIISLVKAMHNNGFASENIAQAMGISIDEVKRILNS